MSYCPNTLSSNCKCRSICILYLRSFVCICKILEFPVCNLSHQFYSVITAKNNKSVTKKKKDKSIFNEPSMPLSWYYCHKSFTDIFKQMYFLCYIKVDGWFSVVVSKLAGKSTWLQELWWELCFHDISQWWVYRNTIQFEVDFFKLFIQVNNVINLICWPGLQDSGMTPAVGLSMRPFVSAAAQHLQTPPPQCLQYPQKVDVHTPGKNLTLRSDVFSCLLIFLLFTVEAICS